MRLPNKIYGLVQAERWWLKQFCYDRTRTSFEQSEADPCVSCKFDYGEVEMVLVVHVDDNLAYAKDQATM